MDFIQISDLQFNRDKFFYKVNKSVGNGNWFWVFKIKDKIYSWDLGFQLYEDAYFQYLRENVNQIKKIVKHYDVFVYNRHDIDSKLNYKKQDYKADHYHDIAIRRCLIRLGLWFKGKKMLNLSKSDLCHSKIPFHLPHLILKPDKLQSVKSYLFSNRFIVITPTIEDQSKLSEMMIK